MPHQLTYTNKNLGQKNTPLGFLAQLTESNEKDLKNILKMKKAHSSSIDKQIKQISQTPRKITNSIKIEGFHITVNSLDIENLKGVRSKQIMFYSDLVHCNDLNKLFTVLDKTPSSTSLSIYRERIKIDLK